LWIHGKKIYLKYLIHKSYTVVLSNVRVRILYGPTVDVIGLLPSIGKFHTTPMDGATIIVQKTATTNIVSPQPCLVTTNWCEWLNKERAFPAFPLLTFPGNLKPAIYHIKYSHGSSPSHTIVYYKNGQMERMFLFWILL